MCTNYVGTGNRAWVKTTFGVEMPEADFPPEPWLLSDKDARARLLIPTGRRSGRNRYRAACTRKGARVNAPGARLSMPPWP